MTTDELKAALDALDLTVVELDDVKYILNYERGSESMTIWRLFNDDAEPDDCCKALELMQEWYDDKI